MTQEVSLIDSVPVINPQDLAELGAIMATTGFTTLQARALMAKVQQGAATVAIGMMPDLLDEVRKIQEARFLEISQRIRLLPNQLGYVNRDRVLQIVQDVTTRTPRQ